jgi:hypothetical protein
VEKKDGKRLLRKSKRGFVDNIKMDLGGYGMEWYELDRTGSATCFDFHRFFESY